jgi:hypothetical protein
LCAVDYRINTNEAPDGAAVYLDWDTSAAGNDVGTSLLLDINDGQCPYSIQTLGAVRCAKGVACNEISNNIGDNSEHALKAGAVVAVGTSSTFQADPVQMRGNSALNLINAVGDNDGNQPPGVTLRDCLIVENQTAQDTISMNGNDAPLIIDNCTVANNTPGSGNIIFSHDTVALTNDIFANVNMQVLDYDLASGLSVNYVLANNISTISPPGSIGVVQGTPTFVNPNSGDYHLAPTSAGIDFAPPNLGTTSFDLDLNQRNVDLSSVTNIHGPIDLGAYELQTIDVCLASDTIFCNGFETP